jgi:hypothetical protein
VSVYEYEDQGLSIVQQRAPVVKVSNSWLFSQYVFLNSTLNPLNPKL